MNRKPIKIKSARGQSIIVQQPKRVVIDWTEGLVKTHNLSSNFADLQFDETIMKPRTLVLVSEAVDAVRDYSGYLILGLLTALSATIEDTFFALNQIRYEL